MSAAGCLANVKPSSASLLTQTLSAGGTLLHRTDKAIILPQQKHWHGPGQLLEARRCGAVKTRPPSATAAWGPWGPLGWDAGPHGMDGGGHVSPQQLELESPPLLNICCRNYYPQGRRKSRRRESTRHLSVPLIVVPGW